VLTSVVSQDPVYVYFQPDEQTFLRYAELARKGERAKSANPVRVGLATDKDYPYTGTVNFINNQVDPATGTINLRPWCRIQIAYSHPACTRGCSSKAVPISRPC